MGNDFNSSFENLNKLFSQVSHMLKDGDRMMSEAGYVTTTGTCITESSQSIESPEKWYPAYVFRTYREDNENGDHDKWVAFIAVFLRYGSGACHDIEGDYPPLIVSGKIMKRDLESPNFREYWMIKSWFWKNSDSREYLNVVNKDAGFNGDIVEIEFDENHKWYGQTKSYHAFSYALDSVKSTKELKEFIVNPLVELIRD